MTVQVLLVSLKFNIPPAEYAQTIKPLVDDILNTPGLRWKIWLIDESQCTAGGVYLFDDSSYVQAFLASPLMDNLQHHQAFTNISVTPFDILDSETAMTHGPVARGARV
jgi:hypothetical protein